MGQVESTQRSGLAPKRTPANWKPRPSHRRRVNRALRDGALSKGIVTTDLVVVVDGAVGEVDQGAVGLPRPHLPNLAGAIEERPMAAVGCRPSRSPCSNVTSRPVLLEACHGVLEHRAAGEADQAEAFGEHREVDWDRAVDGQRLTADPPAPAGAGPLYAGEPVEVSRHTSR